MLNLHVKRDVGHLENWYLARFVANPAVANFDRYPFFVCAYFLHFSFDFFIYYRDRSLSSNPFFSTILPLLITDTPFLAPKMHRSVHFLIQICHLEPQKCRFHSFSVCLSHGLHLSFSWHPLLQIVGVSVLCFILLSLLVRRSMIGIDIDHWLASSDACHFHSSLSGWCSVSVSRSVSIPSILLPSYMWFLPQQ